MADADLKKEFNQLKKEVSDDSDVNQYIDHANDFLEKLEKERGEGDTVYHENLFYTFQKKHQLLKTLDAFVNESAIQDYLIDNVDAIYQDLNDDELPSDQYYKIILHSTGQTLPLNDLSRYNEEEVLEAEPVDHDDKAKAFSYVSDMVQHHFEHLLN